MKFVLSTMTNSIGYTFYRPIEAGSNAPAVVEHKVTIHGGAGIPSLRSGFGERTSDNEGSPVWTAAGIVTPVNESDLERLKTHYLFKRHLDKGLLQIMNTDARTNHGEVARVARGMERDGFSQLNDKTIGQRIKVKMPAEIERETGFRL